MNDGFLVGWCSLYYFNQLYQDARHDMQRSFIDIQVDLNLQIYKPRRVDISSVLRSIHVQLEMEPTSAATEPPPQQHYNVL